MHPILNTLLGASFLHENDDTLLAHRNASCANPPRCLLPPCTVPGKRFWLGHHAATCKTRRRLVGLSRELHCGCHRLCGNGAPHAKLNSNASFTTADVLSTSLSRAVLRDVKTSSVPSALFKRVKTRFTWGPQQSDSFAGLSNLVRGTQAHRPHHKPAFAVGWPRGRRERCFPQRTRENQRQDTLLGIFCSALNGSEVASLCNQLSLGGQHHQLAFRSRLADVPRGSQISFASFTKADIVSSATSLSTSCPSSTEVTSTISRASVCNDRTRSSVPSAPPCLGWIPPPRAIRAVSRLAQDDYVHAVLSASLRWGNSPTQALQLE